MKKTLLKLMFGLAVGTLAACGGSARGPELMEPPQTPMVVDEPTEDLGTSEQQLYCAACGTALACLDGACSYSNGSYQGTGSSCSTSGTYGYRYQCVEFARRYWNQVKGRTFGALGSAGAQGICDLAPSGYQVRWQGDGYTPVHGDLYVRGAYSGNPYGHVAVVDSADGSNVYTVEQNGSCSGRATYARSSARCYLHPI